MFVVGVGEGFVEGVLERLESWRRRKTKDVGVYPVVGRSSLYMRRACGALGSDNKDGEGVQHRSHSGQSVSLGAMRADGDVLSCSPARGR